MLATQLEHPGFDGGIHLVGGGLRSMRPFVECRQATGFITSHPGMDGLPADSIGPGYVGD
jgi:hypothetical protein